MPDGFSIYIVSRLDMLPILGWTVASILGVLSAIHVYWASGGRVAIGDTVPERDGKPLFRPGTIGTLFIAALLAIAALLVLERAIGVPGIVPRTLRSWGTCGVAATLLLRATGEFRYVGFFKRQHGTRFARRDSWVYSPLALGLAIGCAVIAWYGS